MEEIKLLLNEINKAGEDNTLSSKKETTKMLHISLPTLHQCQKEGKIPFYRISGRLFSVAAFYYSVVLLSIIIFNDTSTLPDCPLQLNPSPLLKERGKQLIEFFFVVLSNDRLIR